MRGAEIRAELAGTPSGSIDRATRVSLLAEADSALARAGAVLTLERYPLQHAEVVLVQGLVADAKWRQLGEAEDRPETLAALGVALEQIPESSDPHTHRRLQRVLDRLLTPELSGSRQ